MTLLVRIIEIQFFVLLDRIIEIRLLINWSLKGGLI